MGIPAKAEEGQSERAGEGSLGSCGWSAGVRGREVMAS